MFELQILWHDGVFRDALRDLNGDRMFIATAYLTAAGVAQIQALAKHSSLERSQMTVFLGTTFATEGPGELLRDLELSATVYIVDRVRLHAKVILAEGSSATLILGSANLTDRGLSHNLEFGVRFVPSSDVLAETKAFFAHCLSNALTVDEQIIQAYERLTPPPPESAPGEDGWDALHDSLAAIRNSQQSAQAAASAPSPEPSVTAARRRTSTEALRLCQEYLEARGKPCRRGDGDITYRAEGMGRTERAVTLRPRKREARLDIYIDERPLPDRFIISDESSFHVRVPIDEWDDPEVLQLIDEAFHKGLPGR